MNTDESAACMNERHSSLEELPVLIQNWMLFHEVSGGSVEFCHGYLGVEDHCQCFSFSAWFLVIFQP